MEKIIFKVKCFFGFHNRFVYHYCAKYERTAGKITYIDGIAQLEKRIVCMDDYERLKKIINEENCDIMTIVSLEFLGMEND